MLDGDGTLLLGDEEHPCARAASSRARRAPASPHAFRAGDGR